MGKIIDADPYDHLTRLQYFVRYAAIYRSLRIMLINQPAKSYWRIINGTLLDMSVLEWTKIFGAYDEPTHWTRLVPSKEHDLFRSEILKYIGLSKIEWESYWEQIKEYRNLNISHHKKNNDIKEYPCLDYLLQTSFFYHEWIVKKLGQTGIQYDPEDLKRYYKSCLKQAKLFSQKACNATSAIDESVDIPRSW